MHCRSFANVSPDFSMCLLRGKITPGWEWFNNTRNYLLSSQSCTDPSASPMLSSPCSPCVLLSTMSCVLRLLCHYKPPSSLIWTTAIQGQITLPVLSACELSLSIQSSHWIPWSFKNVSPKHIIPLLKCLLCRDSWLRLHVGFIMEA